MKYLLSITFVAAALWTSCFPAYANEQNSALQSALQPGKFLGAKQAKYPQWFKQSFLEFEDDIDEATEAGKRLALYFHQDGCPYCDKLIKDNFKNPEIGERFRQAFDLVSINMWGDREVVQVGGQPFTEKTLATALNVNFTPTLLFFSENKKVVLRLDGYYPPMEFIHAINYVSGKLEQQQSFADYIGSVKQQNKSGALNKAPWLLPPPYDLRNLAGEKPIAVLFEEPGCEHCDLLHNKTFTDEAADDLLSEFNIIQLNRWSDTTVTLPDGSTITAEKWANKLGLGYAPGILLLDNMGNEALKISAMFRTFHILSAFDYVSSGSYLTEPSFQRFLSARAEHIMSTGKDVDIWKY